MVKIKVVSRAREEEVEGGWYTEERMEKDLGYSKILGLWVNLALSLLRLQLVLLLSLG